MEKIFAALGGTTKVVDIIVKIVIAVAIFLLIRSLYIKWKRRNAGKAWASQGGGALDPGKNYESYAKQAHDIFDNFYVSGEAAEKYCKSLLFLNDNELKEINNRYLNLYGNGTRTLQDAVSDMNFCLSCDARALLLDRFTALGLN